MFELQKNPLMLKARALKKAYNNLEVLKGVDLQVDKGQVVSIVGASGAGKSTLLHILGILDSPDSGSVEINGKNISELNSSELSSFRNDHIGFVFQFHNLLPEFTALENIAMPSYIKGVNKNESDAFALELMKLLGIDSRAHHQPSEMSGGEQQRAAVARALINKPSVVFADEPSGNLDSANAKQLHQLFFELRDKMDQTFVIVTHNEELAAMADKTFEIKDGVIV